MSNADLSRRDILTSVGVGVGALSIGTTTAGAENGERRIVGTSTRAATETAKQSADSVHRVLDFGDIGQAVAGQFSDQAVEALRQNPNVRYIEADGTMHAIAQTLPWGIDRVDADVAEANGETGNGADIAIIDTGIDDDHPDLQSNVGSGKAYVDCRGPNCNYPWSDDHDHGTHCAGIADAVNNSEGVVGVSTEATLHAVKVLDKRGSGSFSDVAAGIEYTADQGWDVGSLSLGASSGSQTVKDACQYASDNGVLLVAAAGNSGPCTDCVGYPAAYDEVMAISSTDSDDSLSGFSSTGPEVELAAPGGDIYSTVIGGYDTFSGTSMACPHVSGTGGQLMANGYTNTKARDQLNSTAEDIGLGSKEQGNGLLDTAAALGLDSSDDLGGSESALAVSTKDATNVGTDSATLNGSLDDLGGADSADVYFEWRESGASSWNTTSGQTLSATGAFSEDISGLTSGTDYDFRAGANASDGDTDTGSTLTFTTDSSTGENAPTVERLSLAEDNSGGSPHADFDASWKVSDADGNLATVDLTLTDIDDGETEDSVSVDVSGDTASGPTDLKAHHEENSGHEYKVKLVVTDSTGNTDSATATEVEDGS